MVNIKNGFKPRRNSVVRELKRRANLSHFEINQVLNHPEVIEHLKGKNTSASGIADVCERLSKANRKK
ncbi:hypothetical protein HGB24_01995 [Candidatus Saccharibacteria bacterium]|nr:hypothetical protein [Candidatus Saccharibacteria bacterium]